MMKQINYCLNLKKIDKTLQNADLVCTKTDGTPYNFNPFFLPLKFIEKIHDYEITLDEAINDQTKLKNFNPRNPEKVKEKKEALKSARKLQDARKDIIDLSEKGIFPYRGNVFKTKEKPEENKFFEHIKNESKGIDYGLFYYYFNFLELSNLAKKII